MTGRKVFIIFLFFLPLLNFGQEKEKFSLIQILDELSNSFGVSFSYLDEIAENVELERPEYSNALISILSQLEQTNNLSFTEVSDGNFVITKSEEIRTFCGYLKDYETKEAIVGATIAGSNFSVSDENGYFQIEIKIGDILVIRSIAFKSKEVSTQTTSNDCEIILMHEVITELPEIEVGNYLTIGINKATDGTIVFVTKPMSMLPGLIDPDILHSLQSLPGIRSVNETVSNINVRGGTNDQTLVLYDGLRMYQTGHFFGLISAFNPQNITSAQLIKNGTTSEYGGGVSGTILLNTKGTIPEKLAASAGINMLYGDANVEIPVGKKGGLFISGRRSIGDLVKTPTYDSYFERAFTETQIINSSPGADSLANSDQRFNFYDLNFKYIHDFSPKSQLDVFGFSIANSIDFTENALVNNILKSKTSNLDQSSLASGTRFKHWWSDKLVSEHLVSASFYELQAVNANVIEDQELVQENEVLDLQVKTLMRYMRKQTDYLFGYHYTNLGVTNMSALNNPSFSRRIKEVNTSHALFAEGNTERSSMILRYGLRLNYYGDFDLLIPEPRIFVSKPITDNISIELTAERKSQLIIQKVDLQTDFLGVEKRKWELVNPETLKILKSGQIALGSQYSKNDALIHIEAYYKKVVGISTISQGFLNQLENTTDLGSYNIQGIDALASMNFGKSDAWISYSFSRNKYHFRNLVPNVFRNNLDVPHSISSGVNYTKNNLDLAIGLNWHSGRLFTPADQNTPGEINYEEPNSRRLSNYLRADFSAKYVFDLKKSKLQLGMSLWNLLDQRNIVNAYYNLPDQSSFNFVERKALPFTVNFSVRISI